MNLNKVIVKGRLVADPRVTQLGNNRKVANFPIALNRYYLDKDRNRQVETSYVDCEFFVSQKFNTDFLKKGVNVFIDGGIKQQKWKDKDGNNQSKVVIRIDQISEEKSQFVPDSPNAEEKDVDKEDAPF